MSKTDIVRKFHFALQKHYSELSFNYLLLKSPEHLYYVCLSIRPFVNLSVTPAVRGADEQLKQSLIPRTLVRLQLLQSSQPDMLGANVNKASPRLFS